MKTANKILFIAFGVVVLAIFSIILIIRFELSGEIIEGSGNIVSETHEAQAFNDIEVKGNIEVYLTQGDKHSIMVYTDDNLKEYIKTDIHRDQLVISLGKRIKGTEKPRVYIEFSDLENLNASAGAIVFAEEAIQGEELSIDLRSGAESHLNLVFEKADIDITTGAEATIKGSVEMLIADIATGSTLNAKNFHAVNCSVNSKSGSQSTVYVSGQLNAMASSGGHVVYTGNPSQKSYTTSGGGIITAYNEIIR
jgi:uncharacterized protein YxeA